MTRSRRLWSFFQNPSLFSIQLRTPWSITASKNASQNFAAADKSSLAQQLPRTRWTFTVSRETRAVPRTNHAGPGTPRKYAQGNRQRRMFLPRNHAAPEGQSTIRHSYSDGQLAKHVCIEESNEETSHECCRNTDKDRFLKLGVKEPARQTGKLGKFMWHLFR